MNIWVVIAVASGWLVTIGVLFGGWTGGTIVAAVVCGVLVGQVLTHRLRDSRKS
jgi:hypothetical protein